MTLFLDIPGEKQYPQFTSASIFPGNRSFLITFYMPGFESNTNNICGDLLESDVARALFLWGSK